MTVSAGTTTVRRLPRAILAGAALLLLVAGIPLMLATTIGDPSSGWAALLAGDVSDDVIIDVLAMIAWAAWGAFAWAVLGEVLSLARGLPGWRLPGVLPGAQHIAHVLVTAAFMALPATAALAGGSANAAHATSAQTLSVHKGFVTEPLAADQPHKDDQSLPAPSSSHHDPSNIAAGSADIGNPVPVQRYTVRSDGPTTWWGIAEHLFGDGRRWRDLWALNVGAPQADGTILTEPGPLHPGWNIVIPRLDHDTNQARPRGQDGAQSVSASPISALPVFGTGAGAGLLVGVTLRELQIRRRRQRAHRRPGRSIAPTPAHLAAVEKDLVRDGAAWVADSQWIDESLRQLAHDLVIAEQAVPDLFAAQLNDEGLHLHFRHTGSQRNTALPHPWTVDADTGRWKLSRQDQGEPTNQTRLDRELYFAPFPTLSGLGHSADGDVWLLDLEHVSVVTLLGDRHRATDLARSLAAELANNNWSEFLDVTMVGIGHEITDLNRDRLTHSTDPLATLKQITKQLRDNRHGLKAFGLTDTLHGRARNVGADSWMPHVLLIDPAHITEASPEAQALHELMNELASPTQRTGIAVIVIGQLPVPYAEAPASPSDSILELIVQSNGQLQVHELGVTLIAQQLSAATGRKLAQLLSSRMSLRDSAMPHARDKAAWAALADAAGAPQRPPSPFSTSCKDSQQVREIGPTVLGKSASSILDKTATTAEDLKVLAPPVGPHQAAAVREADPTLEADLRAWHQEVTPRPRLHILGPIRVVAQGSLPGAKPREAWHTEVVAYLAAHPRGVSVEQLGTDLWPNDPDIATKPKVRQAVYRVRRWLGVNPDTGEDYLPVARAGAAANASLYRIEGLLTDADLFRRLRLRGVTRGPDGIADLKAALDLVAGPPFDQRRPEGYAWLIDTPVDVEYSAMITDVAHLIATHYLTSGQPHLAMQAAETSLAAAGDGDIALLDLVAACDALGHQAEAAGWIRQILAFHDAEMEEDLPPRTADILHRRKWLNQAG
jgi:hypothetical protein